MSENEGNNISTFGTTMNEKSSARRCFLFCTAGEESSLSEPEVQNKKPEVETLQAFFILDRGMPKGLFSEGKNPHHRITLQAFFILYRGMPKGLFSEGKNPHHRFPPQAFFILSWGMPKGLFSEGKNPHLRFPLQAFFILS